MRTPGIQRGQQLFLGPYLLGPRFCASAQASAPAMPPKAKTTTVSIKTASIGIAFPVHGWAGSKSPHCNRAVARRVRSKKSAPETGALPKFAGASGSDLGRLDLQKLAGARDWDRPRLHRLRNLAHEVDV